MSSHKARTPWFPEYRTARTLYKLLSDGSIQVSALQKMHDAITEQMGSAANQADWKTPTDWIPARLSGAVRETALTLWQGSGGVVNPRYLGGELALARTHDLLTEIDGQYRLTDRGRKFLKQDEAVIREVDEEEGITALLLALRALGAAKRSEVFPEWVRLMSPGGDGRKESTLQGKLNERVNNLIERSLLLRSGHQWELTAAGRSYADKLMPPDQGSRHKLENLAREFQAEQRQRLRERLATMHPYRFEQLVGQLLTAMGYEDVTVTKPSSDKGIDVVATAMFGITPIREVVQVKRVASNIGAPTINELRGSLHSQNAIKGMVITLSSFTPQAKKDAIPQGAAPITLVDGDALINLLLKYRVGMRPVELPTLLEVDEATFSQQAPKLEEDEGADT